MSSWFKVQRDLQYHWLWQIKPFSKGQAWVDLILQANYEGKKFSLGGSVQEVTRGEFITSELKLMDRWGWSKSKVRRFLSVIEKELMIEKKSDRKKTTIKLVKYSVYQDKKTTKEPQKNHKETTERHKQEGKEYKEEKKKDYSEMAAQVLEYLNLKSGKRFRPGDKNLKVISARFNDGYTFEDWKKVIDTKAIDWKGDERNDKYLNPETLSRHFDNYLNQKAGLKKKSGFAPATEVPVVWDD